MIEREHYAPPLDREVVRDVAYPERMSAELVERWGDGIPTFAEADPKRPEWRATPVVALDLRADGFGSVLIKNEGDRTSNPTGTIKDRAAWEMATLYRDYARALYLKMRAGSLNRRELDRLVIPRLTMMTAGNEGAAVATLFARYDLPPPKLILDRSIPTARLEVLKRLRADIYLVDSTDHEFTGDELRRLSDNEHGVDITSVRSLHPEAIFYDWHVHESFNERPSRVYVPFGSGRLMENYLHWQERTARNAGANQRDPRLRVDPAGVMDIDVFGAEPRSPDSRADKLTARFKPFLLFEDKDIGDLRKLSFTGDQSAKEQVDEAHLAAAHELLTTHDLEAEPSAAAGLALYLRHYEQGRLPDGEKILIVNTGRGLDAGAESGTESE